MVMKTLRESEIPEKNEPKNYIDKNEMYEEILHSHRIGRCSERLGHMFMALTEKYSHDWRFRNYERQYGKAFKEDLIATGLHACVKAWDKFDPEASKNPFSYFTTCVFRAFIGYLSKEYNSSNIKNALKVDQGLRGDYGYEEMIKEKEDAEKVEDEEEVAEQLVSEDEGDEDEEEPVYSEEEEEPAPKKKEEDEKPSQQPTKRVVYDHLEHMTLWGDDEEEKEVRPNINQLLGMDK